MLIFSLQIRHTTHMQSIRNDNSYRLADRSFGIRNYSKMDLNVWQYEDVRHWFNKDAPQNIEEYNATPSETGYMLRLR